MNWGHGIAIFFACFVGFILLLVVKSFQQNIDLVTENYYQQELEYQHQIEKIKNAEALEIGVRISNKEGQLGLHFPPIGKPVSGEVQIFRPSDARFDTLSTIKPDEDNSHYISTKELPAGFYRIKINWQAGGTEYYTEEALHLR
ncbi:FixH family protein [Nafulsella turpanensis]|uniref:FixH family protein n=1 Tax=Nafulsella turpanensis TaxID=1265690 RepID=UPI00034BC8D0|nr:FixH family protein [Nafulsella turpanensis]